MGRIVASCATNRVLPRESAWLVMKPDHGTVWTCSDAEAWLNTPGLMPALEHTVRAFVEGPESSERTWTSHGELELVRLSGPVPGMVLVHLRAGHALGLPIPADLSPRQLDVAASAAVGVTVDEIALELGIGRETVRTHLKAVYERLDVGTRLELGRLLEPIWPLR